MNPQLLIVGSIGIDTIETPFGKAKNVLGGSCVYAAYAASRFAEVKLVSAIGNDSPYAINDVFRDYDVDCSGVAHLPGKTFRWHGKYHYDLNSRETVSTELGILADLDLTVPDQYKKITNLFIGNLNPPLQQKVIKECTKAKLIGLDTMNFWIDNSMSELKEVLRLCNLLIINESEARQLTGETNLIKGIKILRGMLRPNCVVVLKRGEYGVLIDYQKQILILPGYPLENTVDPTGAGDSFAGAMMGCLASKGKLSLEHIKEAASAASVVASFCVEGFGPKSLATLSKKDYESRLKRFHQLSHFTKV